MKLHYKGERYQTNRHSKPSPGSLRIGRPVSATVPQQQDTGLRRSVGCYEVALPTRTRWEPATTREQSRPHTWATTGACSIRHKRWGAGQPQPLRPWRRRANTWDALKLSRNGRVYTYTCRCMCKHGASIFMHARQLDIRPGRKTIYKGRRRRRNVQVQCTLKESAKGETRQMAKAKPLACNILR